MSEHKPTPWVWDEHPNKLHPNSEDAGGIVAADGSTVCDFGNDEQYYPTAGIGPSDADLSFMLNAVNSHAALTAEVERLRAAKAKLVADVERLRTACTLVAEFRGATDPALWEKVRVTLTEMCHTAIATA